MKLKSLLIVGFVAIAASAVVSSVAQNALSGRVSPTAAPQFSLQNELERPVALASTLEGRKAVLLNFWFAACAPCRKEFPHLEKIYKRFKPQGLEVIAINATDNSAVMQKFRREMKLSFPFAHDPATRFPASTASWARRRTSSSTLRAT
jgi:peroxiredoxin